MYKRWRETHQNASLGKLTYMVVFPEDKIQNISGVYDQHGTY